MTTTPLSSRARGLIVAAGLVCPMLAVASCAVAWRNAHGHGASRDRLELVTFYVGDLIPGWTPRADDPDGYPATTTFEPPRPAHPLAPEAAPLVSSIAVYAGDEWHTVPGCCVTFDRQKGALFVRETEVAIAHVRVWLAVMRNEDPPITSPRPRGSYRSPRRPPPTEPSE